MSAVLPARAGQLAPLLQAGLEDYADEVDIGDVDTQELADGLTALVIDYLKMIGVTVEDDE